MMRMVLYCFLFLLGQALALLKRAAYAIRNPANPVSSRKDFLWRNWDVLLYRAGVEQILFWAWAVYPDGITRLVAMAGASFKMDIPLNPVTAVVAGLAAEVILDALALKVKFLQTEIPQVQAVYPIKTGVIDAVIKAPSSEKQSGRATLVAMLLVFMIASLLLIFGCAHTGSTAPKQKPVFGQTAPLPTCPAVIPAGIKPGRDCVVVQTAPQ